MTLKIVRQVDSNHHVPIITFIVRLNVFLIYRVWPIDFIISREDECENGTSNGSNGYEPGTNRSLLSLFAHDLIIWMNGVYGELCLQLWRRFSIWSFWHHFVNNMKTFEESMEEKWNNGEVIVLIIVPLEGSTWLHALNFFFLLLSLNYRCEWFHGLWSMPINKMWQLIFYSLVAFVPISYTWRVQTDGEQRGVKKQKEKQ